MNLVSQLLFQSEWTLRLHSVCKSLRLHVCQLRTSVLFIDQVPCLAVIKWNRNILTESSMFCKYITPIIRRRLRLIFVEDYFDEKWG